MLRFQALLVASLFLVPHLASGQAIDASKAAPAGSAAAPPRTEHEARTIQDLQALLLEGLQAGPRSGKPGRGTPEYEALQEFIASLVDSKVFVDAIAGIGKGKPWMGREDFVAELTAQAYEAIHAGVVLLPKQDIEFVLRNDFRIVSRLDARSCAQTATSLQLFDPGAPYFGRDSVDDLARTLAITRTVYLGGLAKQPGPPLPSAEQVDQAKLAALNLVPSDERALTVAFASNARKLADDEACTATRAYRKAVLELQGDPGDTLRRHTVVAGVRNAMVARAQGREATAPPGFSPGPVAMRYPHVARRARIEGQLLVRLWIDKTGAVSQAKVIQRKFNKPSLESNGIVVTVAELFDPVAIAFFRAGKFDVRVEDGKAVPDVAETWVTWSLK